MGRSPPTEERAASRPLFTADITIRLQQLVAGWQGAERNQSLFDLHNECLNAAGRSPPAASKAFARQKFGRDTILQDLFIMHNSASL